MFSSPTLHNITPNWYLCLSYLTSGITISLIVEVESVGLARHQLAEDPSPEKMVVDMYGELANN